MGVEGVREKSDRAEEAACDVEDVTASSPLARAGQDERCLPPRVVDECFAQRLGVAARQLPQAPKLTAGVGEDLSDGQFAHVGVGVHAQGMAGLGTDLEPPGEALPPDVVHPVQVAVDPVDAVTVDRQPAATVHPGSPAARLGHLHRASGQPGREQTQRAGVQWRAGSTGPGRSRNRDRACRSPGCLPDTHRRCRRPRTAAVRSPPDDPYPGVCRGGPAGATELPGTHADALPASPPR